MRPLTVLVDLATGPLVGPALLVGVAAALVVRFSGRVPAAAAVAVGVGLVGVGLGQAGWVVLAGLAGAAARDLLADGEPLGTPGKGGVGRWLAGLLAGGAGAGAVAIGLYPAWLAVPVALLAGLVLPAVLDLPSGASWGVWTARLQGLLWLVTLVGITVTVPETDLAVIALAVTVPVAVACGLPAAGGGASLALVATVAAFGGVVRPTSMVGALGCLGVLAMPWLSARAPWWGRLVVHVAVVLVASRVAGVGSDVGRAVLIVTAAFVVAALILPNLRGGRRRR